MARVTLVASASCAALACISILSGLAFTSSEPADSSAIALVRSFDRALNAHAPESVITLLAPDATVQDDRKPQTREQIQGWVEELIRQQIRLELIDQPNLTYEQLPRAATTVTWQARLDLHIYRALGVSFVPATLHANVIDGAITFVSIRPNPEWNGGLDWTELT